ncbi:MAG TPA: hypothetical protein VF897_13755, partial [Roseiflexaceae bacterium]
MRFFEQGVQALRAEARLLAAALRDRRLAVAIAIFAALLLLAAQAPLRYTIAVGQADTFGSDLPLVAGFHAPEIAESTRRDFRWTTERSLIRLPGAGQRALLVGIRLLLVNQEIAERGPRAIELWAGGRLVGRLEPRHTAGEVFRVLLPPPADGSGDQQIELRSATYTPAGDQRAIGAPVDEVTVDSVSWPSLPAWRSTLAWLGAALLLWLALRRIGLAPFAAQALLIAAVLPASLAALLDPPRFAFGASAALTAAALGWLLTLLLVAAPAGLALAGLALALPGAGLRLLGGAAGAALLAVGLALVVAGWLRP